jgi:glycosyltransferase involved in cell wall biosynthesis
LRVLLIYPFFGPYHLARWNDFRCAAKQTQWVPLALQLFCRSDTYDWVPRTAPDGIIDLGLETGGRDNLRWRDVRLLFRILQELRPDVIAINGWGMRDAVLTHLWCRLRKVPRILVTDSQEQDFVRSPVRERVKKEVIRGVNSVFAAGGPHRRYAELLGMDPEAITLGCDVVDNQHFQPAQRIRVPGRYRLLTVARWSAEKNLIGAGRAFLRFVEERPAHEAWSWRLVGYGPLEPELRALAATSGGRIVLVGFRPYAELPATYGDADLYWQPSVREPWGLAVNEAMASGLPVLVSRRCGCVEDLVTEETGWVFDPASERDMIASLHAAAERHRDWPAMGEAAVGRIAEWDLSRYTAGLMGAARIAMARARE